MGTTTAQPLSSPSIQTYTGRRFFPLNPRVEDIDPVDVAHALALKCRYTGQCEFFFSVAQHSVLMSDYLASLEFDYVDQRWALMHDASEAYLPDVASPIKDHIQGFREIEDRLLQVIGERFGLPWPKAKFISYVDDMFYWVERRVLLKDVSWRLPPREHADLIRNIIKTVPIVRWTLERAEGEFWDRFQKLFPDDEQPT